MAQPQWWRIFLALLGLSVTSAAHAGADREHRLGFVVTVMNTISEAPYPPRIAIFAKGVKAEKTPIVALEDSVLDTIHSAQARLAALTSLVRSTPICKQVGPAELNFSTF